jgi:hypothetical protein
MCARQAAAALLRAWVIMPARSASRASSSCCSFRCLACRWSVGEVGEVGELHGFEGRSVCEGGEGIGGRRLVF